VGFRPTGGIRYLLKSATRFSAARFRADGDLPLLAD